MRTRTPAIAAIGALAVLAPQALGHSTAAIADCFGYTVSGKTYPLGGTVTSLGYVDGAPRQAGDAVIGVVGPVIPNRTNIAVPGATFSATYPWTGGPLQGTHTVKVTTSVDAPDFKRGVRTDFEATVVCPIPDQPTPAPAPSLPELAPITPGPITPGMPTVVAPPANPPKAKPPTRRVVGKAVCRYFTRRPANGVRPNVVPKLGQVRVKLDKTGRWAGYRDQTTITYRGGKRIKVTVKLGEFCGRSFPAVAG